MGLTEGRIPLPMTLAARAFITGRFCPRCGYELTGLPYTDRVTCPECGRAAEQSALAAAPPPGPLGRLGHVLAVAAKPIGWTLAIAVVVAMLIAVTRPTQSVRICGLPLRPPTALNSIHLSLVIYAQEEAGGRYPLHAAALIPENYFNPGLLVDASIGCGDLYLGAYDLWGWDGSDEATAALQAAIDVTDLNAPYYRLGDFWWVRLAAPTGDPSIVAGWTTPRPPGKPRSTRWVVFDDGRVLEVNSREWRTLWKADTAARRTLALPSVIPIPA